MEYINSLYSKTRDYRFIEDSRLDPDYDDRSHNSELCPGCLKYFNINNAESSSSKIVFDKYFCCDECRISWDNENWFDYIETSAE